MNRLSFYSIAAGLTACALAAVACKASLEAEAGPGLPLFGGSRVKVDVDGRTCSLPAQELPPGTCVRLNFVGPNGEDLGSTDVAVGGPGAEAPEGTDSITVSPCDPPADKKSDEAAEVADFSSASTYCFRWLPLDLADGRGRFVDFSVLAIDADSARSQAFDFMRLTLAEPRPANVETFGFADVRVSPGGEVRFTAVSDQAPTMFLLTWNGHRVATLRDAHVRRTHGGWYATTFIVPSSAVDYSLPGFSAKNEAEYFLATADRATSLQLSLSVQP